MSTRTTSAPGRANDLNSPFKTRVTERMGCGFRIRLSKVPAQVLLGAGLMLGSTPWCMAQTAQDLLFAQAVKKEHAGQMEEAGRDYQAVLNQLPNSVDAMLGLARVARSRFDMDEARAYYNRILTADPNNVDAINGMGWLDLADREVAQARGKFNRALELQPANDEGKIALDASKDIYRYRLNVVGGQFHNNQGQAWTGGVGFSVELDDLNTFEVGMNRNSKELISANPLDASTLPSTSWHLKYAWQMTGRGGFAVEYENRDRTNYPTEQRLKLSGNFSPTKGVRVLGGVWEGFGTGWKSRTVLAGVGVMITGPWEVVGTVYSQSQPNSVRAGVLDLVHYGTGDAMWMVGLGHTTSFANTPSGSDIHGKMVYRLTRDSALLLSARYSTLRHESQVELGWRKYWN